MVPVEPLRVTVSGEGVADDELIEGGRDVGAAAGGDDYGGEGCWRRSWRCQHRRRCSCGCPRRAVLPLDGESPQRPPRQRGMRLG
jgi:hypothetical protein